MKDGGALADGGCTELALAIVALRGPGSAWELPWNGAGPSIMKRRCPWGSTRHVAVSPAMQADRNPGVEHLRAAAYSTSAGGSRPDNGQGNPAARSAGAPINR